MIPRNVMFWRFFTAFWLGVALGYIGGWEVHPYGPYVLAGCVLIQVGAAGVAHRMANRREEPPWTG